MSSFVGLLNLIHTFSFASIIDLSCVLIVNRCHCHWRVTQCEPAFYALKDNGPSSSHNWQMFLLAGTLWSLLFLLFSYGTSLPFIVFSDCWSFHPAPVLYVPATCPRTDHVPAVSSGVEMISGSTTMSAGIPSVSAAWAHIICLSLLLSTPTSKHGPCSSWDPSPGFFWQGSVVSCHFICLHFLWISAHCLNSHTPIFVMSFHFWF